MTDRLGVAAAGELWTKIPEALAAAVRRAASTRETTRNNSEHVFSNARWPLPYEELVLHLRDVAGVRVVRPSRGAYQLVLAHGQVIVPWYYGRTGAISMRDVRPGRSFGRLARELLRRYGPPHPWGWAQPDVPLLRDEIDERDVSLMCSALDRLEQAPQVLIVGYACTAEYGLLRACLGEASLGDGGRLNWHHVDDLPLPPPAIPRPRRMSFP